VGVKFMSEMIKRSLEYDESFMFNVQGEIWKDLKRFISIITWITKKDPCIIPIVTVDDIIDSLIREGIRTDQPLSKDENQVVLIITQNPWEGFRHMQSIKKKYFLLILNDCYMKAEWYDSMKDFLIQEMKKDTMRIVFFSTKQH
jgi:hypothetical protein